MTTISELIAIIIAAVAGGSGLVGMLFFLLRRYIEKKLATMEESERKRNEARVQRMRVEEEIMHATGRLLFWQYKAIITGEHNGELDRAFQALQAAEARKKEWDRQIIAEARNDG